MSTMSEIKTSSRVFGMKSRRRTQMMTIVRARDEKFAQLKQYAEGASSEPDEIPFDECSREESRPEKFPSEDANSFTDAEDVISQPHRHEEPNRRETLNYTANDIERSEKFPSEDAISYTDAEDAISQPHRHEEPNFRESIDYVATDNDRSETPPLEDAISYTDAEDVISQPHRHEEPNCREYMNYTAYDIECEGCPSDEASTSEEAKDSLSLGIRNSSFTAALDTPQGKAIPHPVSEPCSSSTASFSAKQQEFHNNGLPDRFETDFSNRYPVFPGQRSRRKRNLKRNSKLSRSMTLDEDLALNNDGPLVERRKERGARCMPSMSSSRYWNGSTMPVTSALRGSALSRKANRSRSREKPSRAAIDSRTGLISSRSFTSPEDSTRTDCRPEVFGRLSDTTRDNFEPPSDEEASLLSGMLAPDFDEQTHPSFDEDPSLCVNGDEHLGKGSEREKPKMVFLRSKPDERVNKIPQTHPSFDEDPVLCANGDEHLGKGSEREKPKVVSLRSKPDERVNKIPQPEPTSLAFEVGRYLILKAIIKQQGIPQKGPISSNGVYDDGAIEPVLSEPSTDAPCWSSGRESDLPGPRLQSGKDKDESLNETNSSFYLGSCLESSIRLKDGAYQQAKINQNGKEKFVKTESNYPIPIADTESMTTYTQESPMEDGSTNKVDSENKDKILGETSRGCKRINSPSGRVEHPLEGKHFCTEVVAISINETVSDLGVSLSTYETAGKAVGKQIERDGQGLAAKEISDQSFSSQGSKTVRRFYESVENVIPVPPHPTGAMTEKSSCLGKVSNMGKTIWQFYDPLEIESLSRLTEIKPERSRSKSDVLQVKVKRSTANPNSSANEAPMQKSEETEGASDRDENSPPIICNSEQDPSPSNNIAFGEATYVRGPEGNARPERKQEAFVREIPTNKADTRQQAPEKRPMDPDIQATATLFRQLVPVAKPGVLKPNAEEASAFFCHLLEEYHSFKLGFDSPSNAERTTAIPQPSLIPALDAHLQKISDGLFGARKPIGLERTRPNEERKSEEVPDLSAVNSDFTFSHLLTSNDELSAEHGKSNSASDDFEVDGSRLLYKLGGSEHIDIDICSSWSRAGSEPDGDKEESHSVIPDNPYPDNVTDSIQSQESSILCDSESNYPGSSGYSDESDAWRGSRHSSDSSNQKEVLCGSSTKRHANICHVSPPKAEIFQYRPVETNLNAEDSEATLSTHSDLSLEADHDASKAGSNTEAEVRNGTVPDYAIAEVVHLIDKFKAEHDRINKSCATEKHVQRGLRARIISSCHLDSDTPLNNEESEHHSAEMNNSPTGRKLSIENPFPGKRDGIKGNHLEKVQSQKSQVQIIARRHKPTPAGLNCALQSDKWCGDHPSFDGSYLVHLYNEKVSMHSRMEASLASSYPSDEVVSANTSKTHTGRVSAMNSVARSDVNAAFSADLTATSSLSSSSDGSEEDSQEDGLGYDSFFGTNSIVDSLSDSVASYSVRLNKLDGRAAPMATTATGKESNQYALDFAANQWIKGVTGGDKQCPSSITDLVWNQSFFCKYGPRICLEE